MKIAIAGYGVVGRGTHELLLMNRDKIAARAGEEIEVKYVLDPKPLEGTPAEQLKASGIEEILADPEVKLLVEAIGGVGPAYEYVKAALESGRSVVTPNKQLVAEKGAELLAIARKKNVGFLFEASVAGGTPVLHPISQCLWANDLDLAAGILNGTTNYILTKMVQEGAGFEETLREAQRLGYAEADPTADIEGIDACRKACILADLLFGKHTDPNKVFTQGITRITAADVEAAGLVGCNIKLIGQARRMADGKILCMVTPALLRKEHCMAEVNDVFNAVMVHGNGVGDVMFYGRGAGDLPTASAVLSDVIEIVRGGCRNAGIIGWTDEGDAHLADRRDYDIHALVRIKGMDFAAVEKLFKDCEPIWEKDGETAALVYNVNEGELEKILSGLDAAPYIRMFDC